MPRRIVFELCAETLEACLAAEIAGVDRIELCSHLSEDGLTPAFELLLQAVESCVIPLHVMLRPRAGNFLYTEAEFDVICAQLEQAGSLGAAGFVCGALRSDRTVDIERMQRLTAMAGDLPITFHRAIDVTPNIFQALEAVMASGCKRVLTSGGAPTAMEGAETIAALVEQARDRVEVAVGSGLNLDNAGTLRRTTRASHFHGTVRRPGTNLVDPKYMRSIIQALREV